MKIIIKLIIWLIVIPGIFFWAGVNQGFRKGIKSVNCSEYKTENVQPSPTITPTPTPQELLPVNSGKASYYTQEYCQKFNPGCITASGERFDDTRLTAACQGHIKLGSRVLVTHGDKSIVVVCNDRGSFSESYGRIMDLSKAAFAELAPLSKGVIQISYKIQ